MNPMSYLWIASSACPFKLSTRLLTTLDFRLTSEPEDFDNVVWITDGQPNINSNLVSSTTVIESATFIAPICLGMNVVKDNAYAKCSYGEIIVSEDFNLIRCRNAVNHFLSIKYDLLLSHLVKEIRYDLPPENNRLDRNHISTMLSCLSKKVFVLTDTDLCNLA